MPRALFKPSRPAGTKSVILPRRSTRTILRRRTLDTKKALVTVS